MPSQEPIDLTVRIDRWRYEMLRSLGSPDVVEELESHLLEALDRRLQKGIEPVVAFQECQMELGTPQSLEPQFSLVAKPQPWLPNRVFLGLWIAGMVLGLLVLMPLVAGPLIQHQTQNLGVHPNIALWLRIHVLSLLAGYWTIVAVGGLASWFLLARQMQPFSPGQLVSVRRWLARGHLVVLGFLTVGILMGMFWSSSVLGAYWTHNIKEYACLAICLSTLALLLWNQFRPVNPAHFAAATTLNVALALWTVFGPQFLQHGLIVYGASGVATALVAVMTLLLGAVSWLGFQPPRLMNFFSKQPPLA